MADSPKELLHSLADLNGVHGAEIYRELAPGLQVQLANGELAEIIENVGDGAYLYGKIVESPSGTERVGVEEFLYFGDVRGVLSPRK